MIDAKPSSEPYDSAHHTETSLGDTFGGLGVCDEVCEEAIDRWWYEAGTGGEMKERQIETGRLKYKLSQALAERDNQIARALAAERRAGELEASRNAKSPPKRAQSAEDVAGGLGCHNP